MGLIAQKTFDNYSTIFGFMGTAILYQVSPAPSFEGIIKPMKKGGYSDSGADIAVALRSIGERVITQHDAPQPGEDLPWVFPDDHQGIRQAIGVGATLFWLNTVLFTSHPIMDFADDDLMLVGQDPRLVDFYDDKYIVNNFLADQGLPFLRSHRVAVDDLSNKQIPFTYPVVIKPLRGRGSQGVHVCATDDDLVNYLEDVFDPSRFGDQLLIEPYLAGEEITISVLPAGTYDGAQEEVTHTQPWCLPVVIRSGHVKGITPYSGIEAVSQNSMVAPMEFQQRPEIQALCRSAADAAALLGIKSVVRIDGRADQKGEFHLFDVNFKPNMTGAGRPGRDLHDGLTTLAAKSMGWSYPQLLTNLLKQQWPIKELMAPFAFPAAQP